MDIPPAVLNERITCAIQAAQQYRIPAAILLAVSEKENGRPGMVNKNKNGTSDIGTMQFNSAYIATLARHGITQADVAAAGCYPYQLAAWRLRRHILLDSGDIWTRAANYHSYTPERNAVYRADLIFKASAWTQKLRSPSWPEPHASCRQLTPPNSSQSRNGVQHSASCYKQRLIRIANDLDASHLTGQMINQDDSR